MKNSILNLGKALNKAEQKLVNGGTKNAFEDEFCNCHADPQADMSTNCYIECFPFLIIK